MPHPIDETTAIVQSVVYAHNVAGATSSILAQLPRVDRLWAQLYNVTTATPPTDVDAKER